MKLEAVGAYLKRLREQRGISRDQVAATIRELTGSGTNNAQIQRIEKGLLETKSSVLLAFVKAVGGSLDDVESLLFNSITSEYMGERRADQLLERERNRVELEDPSAILERYGKTRVFGRLFQDVERDLEKLAKIIPEPSGHHVYLAMSPRPTNNEYTVLVDNKLLAEVLSIENNFGWGYSGRGSSNLAHAILSYEYGGEIARNYANRFMYDIIARLPKDTGEVDWILDSQEIALWFKMARLVEEAAERERKGSKQ